YCIAITSSAARGPRAPTNISPTACAQRVPDGCDAYIMKHIIHDWSDEHCRTILKLMRDELPTDGRVLVCEMVVSDEPGPTPAKHLDIEMLVMTVPQGAHQRRIRRALRLIRPAAEPRSADPICVIEAVPTA